MWFFQWSYMDMRMWELDCKESWVSKNWCFWTVVLEKILESPLDCKDIQPVHPKGNQSWIPIGRTDAEAETPILWPPDAKSWLIWKKKHWCWERLRAGGEGDDRGWDGWMASPTQWTWVWVNSGSWWWTGRTGVLQSMGSQSQTHDWSTELNWSYILYLQLLLYWNNYWKCLYSIYISLHCRFCLFISTLSLSTSILFHLSSLSFHMWIIVYNSIYFIGK